MSGMSMELGSVMISDRLSKEMVNVAKDLALRAVAQCALHYNFDGDEAIRLLGLSNVKASEVRSVEVRREKVSNGSCPLPYNGELVESNCHALRKSDFLFTQCKSERKDGSMFCAKCEKISEKTDGVPPYGTIEMRRACDIMEYVAPNGEKPKAFVKIMRYYKTTREEVEREASRLNVVIDERHFEDTAPVPRRGRPPLNKEKSVKGPQGRPKKSKKVLEVEQPEDLFHELRKDNVKEDVLEKLEPDENSVTELDSAVRWLEENVSSPVPKVDDEKAIVKAIVEKCDPEKATKESENAAKAAEKAERRAAKHAENEAKRAAKAAKHAENEAKRAAKAAKRAAKEEVKETAKEEVKETAKEEVKETAKEEVKETAKEEVKETAKEEVKETATETATEEEEVIVKIKYEGKKYLKSKASGVIYDLEKYLNTEVQVVVGQWDEKNDKIKFSACEESEEEEEEYDESDDEEVDDEEVDDEEVDDE
jgi:hypothetical protein